MNAETKEAVNNSIERWERILKGEITEDETTCDLCFVFSGGNCFSIDDTPCPIYKMTGAANCDETPFYELLNEANNGTDTEKYKTLCQKMVDLLKSIPVGD